MRPTCTTSPPALGSPVGLTANSTGVANTETPPQLWAMSEVLDFDVFPLTEHTGLNIRDWFSGVLIRRPSNSSPPSLAPPRTALQMGSRG